MSKLYDVCGIGNAIVDVLSFTEDGFLKKEKLAKGSMQLVDEASSSALYSKLGQTTECSGGSVANSLAGLASLGAKTAFIGKVKKDQLGAIFTHDMRAVGVHFNTQQNSDGPATANCLVMVTPDAQRTMATFLGACGNVTLEDIDAALIQKSSVLYIEGYLWDSDSVKTAIRHAIELAKAAGTKVALTLSDTFCVERHRESFLELISTKVDILFANEAEILSLYESDNISYAIDQVRGVCEAVTITMGAQGSIVMSHDVYEEVPPAKVEKIVDTTGAGDLYAAGFLFGYTKGWELPYCAVLGNRCAARIIAQLGARSQQPLQSLVA
jgi:fructokinase